MNNIDQAIKIFHIFSGGVALISGLAALSLVLKPRIHKKLGKVFFYAMTGVFISAFYMSITRDIPFLLAIAIFSYFLTLFGVRSLQRWKGKDAVFADKVMVFLLAAAGAFLTYRSAWAGYHSAWQAAILFGVFGIGMLWFAFKSWREIQTLPPRDFAWFTAHRANMGGALIATITAFCTTALAIQPELIAWIAPSAVLSPLLSVFIRRTNKIYKPH